MTAASKCLYPIFFFIVIEPGLEVDDHRHQPSFVRAFDGDLGLAIIFKPKHQFIHLLKDLLDRQKIKTIDDPKHQLAIVGTGLLDLH